MSSHEIDILNQFVQQAVKSGLYSPGPSHNKIRAFIKLEKRKDPQQNEELTARFLLDSRKVNQNVLHLKASHLDVDSFLTWLKGRSEPHQKANRILKDGAKLVFNNSKDIAIFL